MTIKAIETLVKGRLCVVRVHCDDGIIGLGQTAPSNPDITSLVLHRHIAPHFLGGNADDIEALVDCSLCANYKFHGSYLCRAAAGVETALWDIHAARRGKLVAEILGARSLVLPVYGSSMRRDISPEDEIARLERLHDSYGFEAFKVKIGARMGRNGDASPGRTERLVKLACQRLAGRVYLKADANGAYEAPRAIEIGRMLQDHGFDHFEEPCPFDEIEQTAEVAASLSIAIAGGEQDHDPAQWRRMLRLGAVDIVQPDVCYAGGLARSLRVARLAAEADRLAVPHSANHSLVLLFALHAFAAMPNAAPFAEYSIEDNWAADLYHPALKVVDGKVELPRGVGWGVQINEPWAADAQRTVSRVDTSA